MVEAEVGENRSSTFAPPRILGKRLSKKGKLGFLHGSAQPRRSQKPQPTCNTTSIIASRANLARAPQDPRSNSPLTCPECGSPRVWKDGIRETDVGPVQRYLCRDCGYRFSLEKGRGQWEKPLQKSSNWHLKAQDNIYSSRQVCVALARGAKNLDSATEIKTVAGETQKVSIEAQIVNYLIYLKNEGRRDATIEAKDFQLRRLIQLGANLNNPESVKRVIADLDKSESYKLLLCIAYEGFAKKNGVTWTRPTYKQVDKLPFVPHESEIDALIAGCGKKTATLLRLLKETAMRLGEAWQIEWKDFDTQNRTITCNHPEKNSRARAFNISVELTQMLQSLPVNSQYIFTCSRQPIGKENPKVHMHNLKRQKGLLGHQRLRVAHKLKNPRIAQIHYHSLRHWKATHLKHQGFDLFDIAAFLGHRSIKNTVLYVHLEKTCYPNGGDDYHSKAARTETETLSLIEAGFEYVCDFEGVKLFRKRK